MGKNILVTGTNGFIGNKLQYFLKERNFNVERISLKNKEWVFQSLNKYDVIIHLAALVHNNKPKAKIIDYMNVNYKLTKQLAEKAQKEGVSQFIFLSTMSVFGLNGSLIEKVQINKETPCKPITSYGQSKLLAEKAIQTLSNSKFVINIVRPPMVYGKNCPGNFAKLIKLAKFNAVFPKIENERSVIHIENLCTHILNLINDSTSCTTHPQNKEFMETNSALQLIRKYLGKKKPLFELPTPQLLKNFFSKIRIFNKIYGNLTYAKDIDVYNYSKQNYNSFDETIKETID